MAAFSDFLENEILDHTLRNASYTPPTSVWIALYTTAPSDSGGGTEVSTGSYARLEVGGGSGRSFTLASAGATENNEDWTFITATANWGTVTATAVLDASTTGNLMYHGALSASKTVNNLDTFKYNSGDFDIALD